MSKFTITRSCPCCGKKFEAGKNRDWQRRFCSDVHRVRWNRCKSRGSICWDEDCRNLPGKYSCCGGARRMSII